MNCQETDTVSMMSKPDTVGISQCNSIQLSESGQSDYSIFQTELNYIVKCPQCEYRE
jgi:hypothetical protein